MTMAQLLGTDAATGDAVLFFLFAVVVICTAVSNCSRRVGFKQGRDYETFADFMNYRKRISGR